MLQQLKTFKRDVDRKLDTTRKELTAAAAQEVTDLDRIRQVQKLDRQSRGLGDLIKALPRLKSSQALDHLITFEGCSDCGKHDSPADCKRDILYYNIDRELMLTLLSFRAQYIDEDFLPRALRHPLPRMRI
jgi:hypothetical protein